ncbi:MAG: hypothetical protein KA760_13550 [Steroidobacteraceae bacterium]|nr:hypothetical protein [Steroidobacteraceae bacterium]
MRQRTILLLALCLGSCNFAAVAQTPACNDAAIMSLKGTWKAFHGTRPSTQLVSQEQYLQVTKRSQAAHALLLEAYPELAGMQEGRWADTRVGPSSFAARLLAYGYDALLTPYFCAPDASPDSVLGKLGAPGKPVYVAQSTDTRLEVLFNNFGDLELDLLRQERGMTVDGLQVFDVLRPTGNWKGHDLYVTRPNLFEKDGLVLLTRKGQLPYRPVTRQQYIEYLVTRLQHQYDDTVVAANSILQNPDTAHVPEFVEGAKQSIADAARIRDEPTARCQEALKKNAADNTLRVPAVVEVGSESACGVFTSEESGGQALVTVNPDYFRKDLPPYVPQFIVIHWFVQPGVASGHFRQQVEANLPIEKFQAMIDQ